MQYKADIIIQNTHEALLGVASTTGVYVYKQTGTPIYIGKAVNLKARLLSHEQNALQDPKESKIVTSADTIELIYTDSEFLALVLEAKLISSIKPRYNVRWRDDKSHLYIKITVRDPYPKVLITRRENDGKSRYFGPFDSMKSVETLVKQIRRIVPFCTQKTIHKGACFYHKIGLCDPCPNIVEHDTEPEKSRDKKRYRAQITTIVRVLDGKTDLVFRSLRKEIRDLTQTQHYEKAMKRRDAMRQLELLIMHGSFIDGNIHLYNRSEQALAALQTILKPYYPSLSDLHRIECYDNSTLSFQNSTASMVVFTDGMVDKKEYRRFKLRTIPNNDFDMMKEVITRRLKNTRWPAPDLIIIDGGKPQVRAVMEVLNPNNNNLDVQSLSLRVGTPTITSSSRPPADSAGMEGSLDFARDDRHLDAPRREVSLRGGSTKQSHNVRIDNAQGCFDKFRLYRECTTKSALSMTQIVDRERTFENLPIIGLAKNPDRIVIGVGNLPTIRPERHNLGYRLLQHMRDEAHRFAKKYHTYLRNHAEVVQ